MAEQRRSVGFLHAANQNVGALLWPEGAIAIVLGLGGGTFLLANTSIANRSLLVADGLTSLGVLLGVVFAAFALVFSQLTDDYLSLLDKTPGGISAFLRPFVFAVGCQVITLFLAMAYRGAAAVIPSQLEVALFLAWAFLFVYSVVDVVALARNVSMHTLWRTELVRRREAQREGTVRDIRTQDKTAR